MAAKTINFATKTFKEAPRSGKLRGLRNAKTKKLREPLKLTQHIKTNYSTHKNQRL